MTDREEKFCKYTVQYIEQYSLWFAQSWYYVKEDPTYIGGRYRCWNKCPIEVLSELHKSIIKHYPSFPAFESRLHHADIPGTVIDDGSESPWQKLELPLDYEAKRSGRKDVKSIRSHNMFLETKILDEISHRIASKGKDDFYSFMFYKNDNCEVKLSDIARISPVSDCYVELYYILRYYLDREGYSLKIYKRPDGMFFLCLSSGAKNIPLAVISEPVEGIEVLQAEKQLSVDVKVTCLGPVSKSFETWKPTFDSLGYELTPYSTDTTSGKLWISEAVKKGTDSFVFGFGETEELSLANLRDRIIMREEIK